MSELLKKLEFLWGLPIFYMNDETDRPKSFGAFMEEGNPLVHAEAFVQKLLQRSRKQKVPVVFKDEYHLYFVCVKAKDGFYFTGPAGTEELNYHQMHQYYKTYGISSASETRPQKIAMMKILTFAGFLYEMLEGISCSTEELLQANGLVEENTDAAEKENAVMEMRRIDEQSYHHTYSEERYVMDCIREGNTEDVVHRMNALMGNAGTLSSKEMNHQKNLAIVSVTMATREAITGGMSPAEAYRLSDLFINRIDRCVRTEELIEYNRKAVYEFTRRVAEIRERKASSNYTEQCKDYIHKNYHDKIRLEDVAAAIGVSQGHLSRVFHEDTGMSIQDYIQKFRVERAANLLKYSEASLTEISDYVCFHSQSHFGSVFKRYMQMTPKQYRDWYKQKEFRSESEQEKRD